MNFKEEIILFAKNNNIDKIGFCNAEPFYNVQSILTKRIEKGYLSGFEEKDIKKRIYPHLTMDNAKSIIVIAEGYNKKFEFESDNRCRGKFSLSAIGEDYHIIVKRKLQALAKYLQNFYEQAEYKIFVDTGPLLDREVAKRAAIGWQGKNGSIITDMFGSWVFIGYMLINIEIAADEELKFNCGNCKRCIDSCPTGALKLNYEFDAKRCISYLTQTKDIISEELSKKMGVQLYGCDICQKVCPHNIVAEFKETIYDINLVEPEIEQLLNMSNKDFKKVYGNTAIAWRGKNTIQRNARIALKNGLCFKFSEFNRNEMY